MINNKKKSFVAEYRNACKLRDSGDFKKALKAIDSALNCSPSSRNNFKFLITRGEILKASGLYLDAEKMARKAITVKPTHWAGWLMLGTINFDLKKYEKAAYCYKKAASKKQDFSLFTMLANSELVFDPQSALKHAERAIKLNSGWAEAIKVRDKATKLIAEEMRKKTKD